MMQGSTEQGCSRNGKTHLYVSGHAAAAHHCAWTASHRRPSCRQKGAPPCEGAREPAAGMSCERSFRTQARGRYASSSPDLPTWRKRKGGSPGTKWHKPRMPQWYPGVLGAGPLKASQSKQQDHGSRECLVLIWQHLLVSCTPTLHHDLGSRNPRNANSILQQWPRECQFFLWQEPAILAVSWSFLALSSVMTSDCLISLQPSSCKKPDWASVGTPLSPAMIQNYFSCPDWPLRDHHSSPPS